jgi:CTP synthase (UTP-ammonia lyase)
MVEGPRIERRTSVRIAIVGDYQPDHETHPATAEAIGHAAGALGLDVEAEWLATDALQGASDRLRAFGGLLIAPGSPYRSLDGALEAIAVAREHAIPLLGTCAGFQHLVLEYARNGMGMAEAAHAEYEPEASVLFVTPLSCSLQGQTFEVRVAPDSRAGQAYGTAAAIERYYCNFGLNPAFSDRLVAAGLAITGTDTTGEPRIVELVTHPFFVGTLFVPQTSSSRSRPHPLVLAFVQAAAQRNLSAPAPRVRPGTGGVDVKQDG